VNCKTVNGKVPVELLIADDSKEQAVRKEVPPDDVRPFLELLPKELVDPITFVRTGNVTWPSLVYLAIMPTTIIENLESLSTFVTKSITPLICDG
jgi:hypothetical protein